MIDAITSWGQPRWLWGLLMLPVLMLALWWSWRRSLAALTSFARPAVWPGLGIAPSGTRAAAKSSLAVGAIALLVLGLARPRGAARSVESTASGRDVVFLVDVSRSMLATDLAPSRLGRAKLWIKDVASILRGDRVALVAFAGASIVKCPLTLDYAYFRLAVDDLSPASVGRGGSLIGDAIRRATTDVFLGDEPRPRDIILITDGEDQESFPTQAAEEARTRGVRIIAVGVGDPTTGSAVPAAGAGSLADQNPPVISRQDTSGLAAISAASAGGVYFNVGTGTIALDEVYRDLVLAGEKTESQAPTITVYDEYFQLFLAAAAALLVVDAALRRHARAQPAQEIA